MLNLAALRNRSRKEIPFVEPYPERDTAPALTLKLHASVAPVPKAPDRMAPVFIVPTPMAPFQMARST
jgi:hypothetical protein